MGHIYLKLEILGHRELFEKNFPEIYSITKRELAAKLENETIHDRIFGNWVIPLATFRTLETVINVPFSYAECLIRQSGEYAIRMNRLRKIRK